MKDNDKRPSTSEREESFRQAIQAFRDVPPNRETGAARRRISELAPAGMYEHISGQRVEIFGPVVTARHAPPDDLFTVQARYLEGENQGRVFSIPIFTDDGYIRAYRPLEK